MKIILGSEILTVEPPTTKLISSDFTPDPFMDVKPPNLSPVENFNLYQPNRLITKPVTVTYKNAVVNYYPPFVVEPLKETRTSSELNMGGKNELESFVGFHSHTTPLNGNSDTATIITTTTTATTSTATPFLNGVLSTTTTTENSNIENLDTKTKINNNYHYHHHSDSKKSSSILSNFIKSLIGKDVNDSTSLPPTISQAEIKYNFFFFK